MLSNVLTTLENLVATLVLETSEEDPPASPAEAQAAPAADETLEESPKEEPKQEEKVPMAVVKEVRKEAANYRTQLRTLEKQYEELKADREKEVQEAELAKLEGIERYQKESEILKEQLAAADAANVLQTARNDTMVKEAAIRDAASKLKFHNPGDAAKMVDMKNIGIDDGKVDTTAVEEAVQSLAQSQSYLIQGITDGSFGGPTNPKPSDEEIPGPNVKFTDVQAIAKLKDQARSERGKGNAAASLMLMNQVYELEHPIKSE